ncbi:hypothetical protein [Nocardia wallacei]|uniref:hypothetical protein n=1 Tax=Nocardia wallacei TaxID=480035 RepID=UPI001E303A4B|nr:hypothetical protein [Nocardia wallacei]
MSIEFGEALLEAAVHGAGRALFVGQCRVEHGVDLGCEVGGKAKRGVVVDDGLPDQRCRQVR